MERRGITVCADCLFLFRSVRSTSRLRTAASTNRQFILSRSFTVDTRRNRWRQFGEAESRHGAQSRSLRTSATESRPKKTSAPVRSLDSLDLNALHARIQELSSSVLKPSKSPVPDEQLVLYVLEQLESIGSSVLDDSGPDDGSKSKASRERSKHETAASALLGTVNSRQYPAFVSRDSILSTISQKAEETVRSPDVFITPAILKSYVQLQTLLHQPSSFPDIFNLYARKPIPRANAKSSSVDYLPASPDKINSAIDSTTANLALTSAIQAHNLPLAIDVITTSFSTLAFKKAKVLRQASLPIAGLGIAPVAAYTLSSQFANLQQTMDPRMATGVAFAGILTYVGAVGMMGYVTITTANDQMERVTWASGVPLWERWIREEERAAVDRIACAWGFKEIYKRGEEEGVEWENLREWIGMRGMILDRVSLMEGME